MKNPYKVNELINTLQRLDFDNLFEFEESDDVDIFRLHYDNNGVTLTLVIAPEDSNWTLIRYYIAECHNPIKKEQMLDLLNELNKIRRTKYFIDKNNQIVSELHYLATDDYFDAGQVIHAAIMFLKGIEEKDYPKIMRVLWS